MRVHCVELKCDACVFSTYGVCLPVEAGIYLNDKTVVCHLDVRYMKSEPLKLEKNAKLDMWTYEISNSNANT